ncbi:MAG: helix-turn-helix domain-containing protein [Bdellovibrionales bacterium]|nr:helix-turn-helix domain-containing protein [Bdellovibrionales bacterium]
MTINELIEELELENGPMTFGSVLKAWRESEEATQKEYAKMLKISQGSYADLESGRRIPSPTRAAYVAKKLGVGEETLILLALRDYLKSHGFDYKLILETA